MGQVTLGGERLGAGKRNKISLKEYERSTHDLSYVWRSTMAAGTLVPFMTEVALPGDTFDINLNVDILTHPTIGPLFGSYKIQLDVFQVPIRLYQGKLHMNMLGIGMNMSQIHLPVIEMEADRIEITKPIDNQQINPSSILSYLGMRGLGYTNQAAPIRPKRQFNAITLLGYWDIYKNYYANKQEEIGAVIHKDPATPEVVITSAALLDPNVVIELDDTPPYTWTEVQMNEDTQVVITATGLTTNVDGSEIFLRLTGNPAVAPLGGLWALNYLFENIEVNAETETVLATKPKGALLTDPTFISTIVFEATHNISDTVPNVVTFPLENIDLMRIDLLEETALTVPFKIDKTYPNAPYNLPFKEEFNVEEDRFIYSKMFGQEGLGLKTYNSDLFNNWISTEWIDGVDGISEITAIDTSGGSFTIDELNLSKKIYDMLNRIAISGGSYDDWLDAVYTHERTRSAENPMYLGGLIRNLVFQEVVSNAESGGQPLGTLAGRGTLGEKKKGGHVVAKIDEPSYLMGIISLTPNIDYSQGNKWDTNLKTMNDFHKPALDEIGFQDLITDQMAWFDTELLIDNGITFKSAGKQPAWINYMTNVNVVKGNFAEQSQQMFMVLNRRYTAGFDTPTQQPLIGDLTTYIDPTKFNHIFADTRRDAQNFWAQIGVNIEARRKMSAKVIPNL